MNSDGLYRVRRATGAGSKPEPVGGRSRDRPFWPVSRRYRYPTEFLSLALTLAAMALTLRFFWPFPMAALLISFFIGLCLNYLIIHIVVANLKRQAIQVTETQFPEIKALVEECRQYLPIPPDTQIFVTYNPLLNAFAIGFGRPNLIVLHSALVEALDPEELKFVIGHEMGHIKFKHTFLQILIGQLGRYTYFTPLIGNLIYLIFLFWSRACELTADRAGLVACGRLDKAISAHLKLMVGPGAGYQVNLTALAQQANEARGMLGMLNEVIGSHPLGTTRIQRLVDFAASEMFRQLRPEAEVTFSARPAPDLPVFPAGGYIGLYGRLEPAPWPLSTSMGGASFLAPVLPSETSTTTFKETNQPPVPGTQVRFPPLPEVAFDRVNIAIARANLEQAEGWLRLTELLQQHGQVEQADQYRRQAQSLMVGLASATTPGGALATNPPCPGCGQANLPDTPHCYHCQHQLLEPCLNCRIWLVPGHDNCKQCGQSQAEIIQSYKAEAAELRQIVKQPIPPAWPPRWQIIYSLIFLIDLSLVTFGLARQMRGGSPFYLLLWDSLPYLVLLAGLMSGFAWLKRLADRRRYILAEIGLSVKRYNQIADTLALRQVSLRPSRLMTRNAAER